jgi:hypothetical protein
MPKLLEPPLLALARHRRALTDATQQKWLDHRIKAGLPWSSSCPQLPYSFTCSLSPRLSLRSVAYLKKKMEEIFLAASLKVLAFSFFLFSFFFRCSAKPTVRLRRAWLR